MPNVKATHGNIVKPGRLGMELVVGVGTGTKSGSKSG
jgi:hypothetical protein